MGLRNHLFFFPLHEFLNYIVKLVRRFHMTLSKGDRKSNDGPEPKSISINLYLDLSGFWLKTVEYQDVSSKLYF